MTRGMKEEKGGSVVLKVSVVVSKGSEIRNGAFQKCNG
jgi:hypothetical protein